MFAWRHQLPGIGLAFTDRHGGVSSGTLGSLNLGRTDRDRVEDVAQNFALLGSALDVDRFITTHQVHGVEVLRVDHDLLAGWPPGAHLGQAGGGAALPIADAIVATADQCPTGVALTVRVADCLPVVFADPAAGVLAVAHAGRVGLLDGVLPATVATMRDAGANQIQAWIGPHVCGGCYEVPDAMASDAWQRLPQSRSRTSWGTAAIDLAAGAEAQLVDAGVLVEQVGQCTLTTPGLHSHRRDGAEAGRLVGLAWFTG